MPHNIADTRKDEAKRKALRDALDEGECSGYIEDFDFDDFLAKMNKEYKPDQFIRKDTTPL